VIAAFHGIALVSTVWLDFGDVLLSQEERRIATNASAKF
jgi:hypothetical protein